MPLGVIGLLECFGLRQQAQNWIRTIKSATAGRLLITYLFMRELSAAMGLMSLGGHAQMVRPLIAPMVEGTTENIYGKISGPIRHKLRAYSAATDNIVPISLLELPDKNAVIKVQAPTALILLVVNIFLLYFLM